MALVRGNKKGTTHGLKVVRLVILAIMFGQAELSAPESAALRTCPRRDREAFRWDWEVAKKMMPALTACVHACSVAPVHRCSSSPA